jgi:Tfp pilus assembly protein PilN
MIKINLLPEKEKRALKKERLYQSIFISVLIICLVSAVIGLELFLAKRTLENSLSLYTLMIKREEDEVTEKTKRINSELLAIDEIQNNYFEITPILISLSEITPKNSYIKFFSFDKEKKEFQIKGWAKSRSDLLEFQNNLEKSKFFTEIEYPLSNLLKEEDIDFEFKGKIKL